MEMKKRNLNSKRVSDSYYINGKDRFQWYLRNFHKKTNNRQLQAAESISLLYAYEFEHEITVTSSTWKLEGFRVFCRYLGKDQMEISDPLESFTYPEYTVSCYKRNGTDKIGLSVERYGHFEPLPIINRMRKEPKYELSMCVATIYGDEPKWLNFIEMMEHYKLQGVEHFYLHIHNASNYDLKVINDYMRTGELEVHYLLEKDEHERDDNHWHMVNIADCLVWSRMESKWTIFADLDERILMTNYSGTILDYMREITDEKIGGVQFRQQWILKTELMPEKYEGDSQIDTWMPTRRWHNSSAIGPEGHTAKCIVDPSKVYNMFIHYVNEFYPGHEYFLKQIDPSEGIVRHYRDLSLGGWGHKWLNSTLEFGPLRDTNYPEKYIRRLTENVKKRAKDVYGREFN